MGTNSRNSPPDATAPNSGGTASIRPSRLSPSRPARLVAACLAIVAIGLPPAEAGASEGEASVWVAAEGANAGDTASGGPQFGLGAQAGLSFGISDFWTLNFGAETAFHPAVSPGDEEIPSLVVQNLFAGFRYNVDIFVYVPYIKAAAVAYPLAPRLDGAGNQRPAVGAKLTVGVDWRFDRHWSLGPMAELHAVQFDFGDFPSYSSVGLRLSHHFRL